MKRKGLHNVRWQRLLPAAFAVAVSMTYAGVAIAAPQTGAQIYQAILKKYPTTAMNPDVRGLATSHPTVTLYIPEVEWKRLSAPDRQALTGFMPSLVKKVQANPAAYVGIPEDAPIYSRFLSKLQGVGPKDWEVITGKWLPQRRTMTVDRTVAKGF